MLKPFRPNIIIITICLTAIIIVDQLANGDPKVSLVAAGALAAALAEIARKDG